MFVLDCIAIYVVAPFGGNGPWKIHAHVDKKGVEQFELVLAGRNSTNGIPCSW